MLCFVSAIPFIYWLFLYVCGKLKVFVAFVAVVLLLLSFKLRYFVYLTNNQVKFRVRAIHKQFVVVYMYVCA